VGNSLRETENSGLRGRYSRRCRRYAGSRRCYECGQEDHLDRDHRTQQAVRGGAETALKKASVVTTNESLAKVYLSTTMGGKRIAVLLDTGCENNLCPRKPVNDAALEPTSQRLIAANGTQIPLLGKFTTEIRIGRKSFQVTFVVSEAVSEMILGCHFCRKMNVAGILERVGYS
jgi:hypothetical protein